MRPFEVLSGHNTIFYIVYLKKGGVGNNIWYYELNTSARSKKKGHGKIRSYLGKILVRGVKWLNTHGHNTWAIFTITTKLILTLLNCYGSLYLDGHLFCELQTVERVITARGRNEAVFPETTYHNARHIEITLMHLRCPLSVP